MKAVGTRATASNRRGYTMVEVMMGLAILAVGATGIVSLQRFAVMGTMTSRHVSNASNVAGSVIETMNTESVLWTQNAAPFDTTVATGMPWLGTALDDADGVPVGGWVAPPFRAFALDGTPMDPTAPTAPVAYCTQVRAAWLGSQAGGVFANGTLNDPADAARLEVRTFYAKSGRSIVTECATWDGLIFDSLMAGNAEAANGLRTRAEYGVVYFTTIVRRNTL